MREMKLTQSQFVSQIPSSWSMKRLKYFCEIDTGNQDTQDSIQDGTYPLYVRSPIIERSNRYTFDGEGILMAGDGAGAGRIFHHVNGKYGVHQRVYRLGNFNDINTDFLFYYISSIFPNIMDQGSAQSTVPSVRLPMLKDLQIALPPIVEQQQIVDFLDKNCSEIDEALSRHQTIIEKLGEYRKALITKAVTKGLDSNVEMKDSGITWIGAIPTNWSVKPLWALYSEHKKKNTNGVEQNLLSLSYGNIIRKDINAKEGLLPENFNGYNIVEKDDIVLRLTDLQNDKRSLRTGLVKEQGIITSAYVTLRPIQKISSEYYHYLLHAFDITKGFYSMGEGVRQNLNYTELSKMLLSVPSITEQIEIAEYLKKRCSEINESIVRQKAIIEKLEAYKKSLIYYTVTGKIDCREVNTNE
ncbi:MAG: restriction endonuclease subunit S [Faecalimonas sp.]|nr:restriction endonuclease subunit S [Faecalimonas sp.]